MLSGGAPLAEEAHSFIRTALCLKLHQGYGLTETASTAIITDPDDISVGRVGSPLQGVDIKVVTWGEGGYSVTDTVGARGEIHVGGHHVAAGYYNMPEKTAEEFYDQDGKSTESNCNYTNSNNGFQFTKAHHNNTVANSSIFFIILLHIISLVVILAEIDIITVLLVGEDP